MKLELPKLKKLILYDLFCMDSFVKLENPSSLFLEKIDFPSLEELVVNKTSNEVTGLWKSHVLNPAPRLTRLELKGTKGLRRILPVILKNLSSLTLNDFEYEDALFSSSDILAKEQLVWTYSVFLKLKELEVYSMGSLKELFQPDDCVDHDALVFCGQLKKLKLSKLPALNLIPLRLFTSLASLTLSELKWEYLISAAMLENSLLQLEHLSILDCHSMEAVIINVVSDIELPRLKKLAIEGLCDAKSFFSTPKKEATLRLPSLESIFMYGNHRLEHFWTGSIFAPKLRELFIYECMALQHAFQGNPETMAELSSLQEVKITSCYSFKSIFSRPLKAPILRKVDLFLCCDMECFLLGSSNNNSPIDLPFLEVVNICHCRKLQSFSLTPLRTPNLTHVLCD